MHPAPFKGELVGQRLSSFLAGWHQKKLKKGIKKYLKNQKTKIFNLVGQLASPCHWLASGVGQNKLAGWEPQPALPKKKWVRQADPLDPTHFQLCWNIYFTLLCFMVWFTYFNSLNSIAIYILFLSTLPFFLGFPQVSSIRDNSIWDRVEHLNVSTYANNVSNRGSPCWGRLVRSTRSNPCWYTLPFFN